MKIAHEIKARRIIVAAAALGIVGGGVIWRSGHRANAAVRHGMVYSAAGFGGYIPAVPVPHKSENANPKSTNTPTPIASKMTPKTPVDLNASVLQAAEA